VPVPTVPTWHGIDVSGHQETADLRALPGDFAIIKASEGVGWADPSLAGNVTEARAGNKAIGFYHFARPNAQSGNTARAEAESFLAIVTPHLKVGDRVVLDWESDDMAAVAWAKEWLDIVAAATQSKPMIYMSSSVVNAHDWSSVESTYPLWLAMYLEGFTGGYNAPAKERAKTEWKAGFEMWQYTSSGRLDGYGADLDLNVFFGTAELWAASAVKKVPVNPAPAPDPVPMPDPAIPVVGDSAGTAEEFWEWFSKDVLERFKGRTR
jgi:GH25 family lysozyme M1 (1,4-beta-N-acetylmuramidase)